MQAQVTVAERLRSRLGELTRAQRKVARALMAGYPAGGLEPVAKLAAAAGVSPPTVIRLVAKLEFDGGTVDGIRDPPGDETEARDDG